LVNNILADDRTEQPIILVHHGGKKHQKQSISVKDPKKFAHVVPLFVISIKPKNQGE